jgi:hypothetical protein
MVNLSEWPFGWKVYALTWVWLGIIVGFADGSFVEAAVVWAFGASAAWLLASTVTEKGWPVAVRYLAAVLVSLAALLMGVAAAHAAANMRSAVAERDAYLEKLRVSPSRIRRLWPEAVVHDLRERTVMLAAGTVVLGFFALVLWNPTRRGSQARSLDCAAKAPEKPRCPQCGKFTLFRTSDARLRCYCGYKSPAGEVAPTNADIRPQIPSQLEVSRRTPNPGM